jgi:hypothetical protein
VIGVSTALRGEGEEDTLPPYALTATDTGTPVRSLKHSSLPSSRHRGEVAPLRRPTAPRLTRISAPRSGPSVRHAALGEVS